MDERQPAPGIPIETPCIAGRILRGVTNEDADLLSLTCESGRELCVVRCQLTQVIYKREYQEAGSASYYGLEEQRASPRLKSAYH